MPSTKKAAPAVEEEQPAEPSVKDQVRQLFEEGTSRSELREMFGLTYPQVYNWTKDLTPPEGASGRHRVLIDDPENPGTTIARAEAMRRDFANGMSVGDIARKYETIYQVAYQATKGQVKDDEADEAEADGEETEA